MDIEILPSWRQRSQRLESRSPELMYVPRSPIEYVAGGVYFFLVAVFGDRTDGCKLQAQVSSSSC